MTMTDPTLTAVEVARWAELEATVALQDAMKEAHEAGHSLRAIADAADRTVSAVRIVV